MDTTLSTKKDELVGVITLH